MQDKVILWRMEQFIAQWCNKFEGRQEWKQHVGLYEKWQALVGRWQEILSVVEGTKWTRVGD